jgi:hypothetical protein
MIPVPPGRRRAVLAVLGLAALVALGVYGDRRVEAMGGFPERARARGATPSSNDFNVYWGAADALEAPDLFTRAFTDDGRRYIYPPFLAAALRPLRPLGITGGAITWFVLSAAGAIVGTWFAVRAAAGDDAARRTDVVALVAGLAVAGRFFGDDFGNGNANSLVLAACAGGTLAFARGRDALGAAAFALATALKVTPGLALVWMLARRRFAAAAVFATVLAVLVVGVPALTVGPGRAIAMNRDFLAATQTREASAGEDRPVNGSSLRAAIHRWTTDVPIRREEGVAPPRLATLVPADADRVFLGVAVGVVLALGVGWARARGPGTPDARRAAVVADLALVLVASALLSPVTRKAHLVTLVLPAAVAGVAGWGGRVGGRASRVPRAGLAAACALSWLANASLVGRRVGALTWGANVLCIATIALAVAVIAARRGYRGAGPDVPDANDLTLKR